MKQHPISPLMGKRHGTSQSTMISPRGGVPQLKHEQYWSVKKPADDSANPLANNLVKVKQGLISPRIQESTHSKKTPVQNQRKHQTSQVPETLINLSMPITFHERSTEPSTAETRIMPSTEAKRLKEKRDQ